MKLLNNVNSIRPDGGTSLRALCEVRSAAPASLIGKGLAIGGAGQRNQARVLRKNSEPTKSRGLTGGWLETEWQEA